MQVEAIDHVTFVVSDLERSHQFYADILGMTSVPRPAFDFAGAWYQAGSTLIHLILNHDRSGAAGPRSDAPRSTRAQHLAFRVPDAKQAFEELPIEALEIISPPKLRPDGAIQCFIADPDGHIIEICSDPE